MRPQPIDKRLRIPPGAGDPAERLLRVHPFVRRPADESLAGDTVWCPEVGEALTRYRPDVTVVNAGGAQFLTGGPITMTGPDIEQVCRALPETRIVAIHIFLETVPWALRPAHAVPENIFRY